MKGFPMDHARRKFIGLTALGVGLAFSARAQETQECQQAQCYDPLALPLSQRNRRRSVNYVETSADANRRCGLCIYFAATQGNCGSCQILTSVVNAGASCASFAQRAG